MTDPALVERSVPDTRFRLLLATAALAALAFTGVYLIAVHTHWGQRLDATALEGSSRVDRPRVQRATENLLTTVTVGSVAFVGVGIVVVALGRGRFHLAVAAGLVAFGSDVSAELLKRVILTRPDLTGPGPHGLVNTFPSGHTTVAMSLALAAVLVTPARARGLVAVIGASYAIGIGEAVLISGWHRPSDAIGSYLLVMMWAALAASWLASSHARLVRRPRSASWGTPIISPVIAALGAATLAVSFIGMATVAVALRADRLDAVGLDTAYFAAAAAILGVGALVTTTFVSLLRGLTLDPIG